MKEKTRYACLLCLMGILFWGWLTSCQANRHPMVDRVPTHATEEAQNYKAPFGDARKAPLEALTAGQKLYEGQGRCITCHGKNGKGDGPAAHMHQPPPRDFSDCEFQNAREDGELYWVIKHGSPGTGMQSMIPHTITEEQGWDLVAYIRSFCKT